MNDKLYAKIERAIEQLNKDKPRGWNTQMLRDRVFRPDERADFERVKRVLARLKRNGIILGKGEGWYRPADKDTA